MDKKHNYYTLDQKNKSFWASLLDFLSLPFKIPAWFITFFLARDVSHIAINPNAITEQRPIHLVRISNAPQEDIILVNFKKKQKSTWFNWLLGWVPFISLTSPKETYHNNDEDKEYVNQILEEVYKLIEGTSNQKNCAGRHFDWSRIYFKGMEFLDAKMRTYIFQQLDDKYKKRAYEVKHGLNMEFFTLKTTDNTELDSVALMGDGEKSKLISERKFVLTCIDRDQNYIHWIKDLNYTAKELCATAISFNYRGIDLSRGRVWTQQHMIDDVLAQVERLMQLGARPEHICLDGMGVSAAIATLAAAQLHSQGHKVKLNNERSFRSLPLLVFGFLAPELHSVNWWSPITYARFAFAGIAYLVLAPVFWLAGWHADAGSAWESIPLKDKIFSVVRDKETHTYDGVINDNFSSIASLVDGQLAVITEKIRNKSPLTNEERCFLIEYDQQHHFKPKEQIKGSKQYSCPHFISRGDLVAEQAHQKYYTNHDFFLNKLNDKFTIDRLLEKKIESKKPLNKKGKPILRPLEEKPLILASSGGGGHISAAKGIMNELQAKNSKVILTEHQAILYKKYSFTLLSGLMRFPLWLISFPAMESLVNLFATKFNLPAIPKASVFWEQMAKIQQGERIVTGDTENGRLRPYVDMLLDICPAGYESAAWYNATYLSLTSKDITAMTSFQHAAEQSNYSSVFQKILNSLMVSAKQNTPYTSIISTQALSINAICDAVLYYNNSFLPDFNKEHGLSYPQISIAQYLTDLPTIGCNHFMDALEDLSLEQRQTIEINAVYMSAPIKAAYFGGDHGFKAIHNIEPSANPMVRSAFKESTLKNYADSSKECALNYIVYQPNPETRMLDARGNETLVIEPEQNVASIMLGSLATTASADYVTHLLNHGYDTVFVFGGLNSEISKRLDKLIASYPKEQQELINHKIIRLGNQSDVEMAPIFTRSNCVVIRGGGLSVMEQMAMPVIKNKVVLMHHEERSDGVLTSGLSWEDSNADRLINYLEEQKVKAVKTSPERCSSALKEAQMAYTLLETFSDEILEKQDLVIEPQAASRLKPDVHDTSKLSEHPRFFCHKPATGMIVPEPTNNMMVGESSFTMSQ